jgi:hypothetical protein
MSDMTTKYTNVETGEEVVPGTIEAWTLMAECAGETEGVLAALPRGLVPDEVRKDYDDARMAIANLHGKAAHIAREAQRYEKAGRSDGLRIALDDARFQGRIKISGGG